LPIIYIHGYLPGVRDFCLKRILRIIQNQNLEFKLSLIKCQNAISE
jgi:hypothetical protein